MRKVLKGLLLTSLAAAIVFVGFIGFRGWRAYEQLMAAQPLQQRIQEIESDPNYVPYEDLPQTLVEATVDIEDRRFYDHGALDFIGLARAALSQVVPGMARSGGSTITQQLAKNMYGLFDTSLDRKGAEFFLAFALEQQCSKQEILTLYVNIINYGNEYIGIGEAAAGYFGLYPSQLSAAQCTLLAGVPQAPGYYNLATNMANAKVRQQQVLAAMVRQGDLTQAQADEIYAMPV